MSRFGELSVVALRKAKADALLRGAGSVGSLDSFTSGMSFASMELFDTFVVMPANMSIGGV